MSEARNKPAPRLVITADDWGYSARYNAGIIEAARAGAVDAVSAMVMRPACEAAPLLEIGVAVGLHLEAPREGGGPGAIEAPQRQAERFQHIFGRPPAHIDGHRNCHARLPLATAAEELAIELDVPLRPAGEDHRRVLADRGIRCPDRVVGRLYESEPALPDLIAKALRTGELPRGLTEWVVHPGQSDPASGSSYDRGREEDFALLVRLSGEPLLTAARGPHSLTLPG